MKERDFTNIVLPSHIVDSTIIDEILEYFSSKKKPKNQIFIKPRIVQVFNWIIPNQFKNDIKINSSTGEIIRNGTQYGSMWIVGEKPLPQNFQFNVILDHFSQKPGFCIGITQSPKNPILSNGNWIYNIYIFLIIFLYKDVCLKQLFFYF